MTMENITETVKPPDASGKNDLPTYASMMSGWLSSLYITLSTRINWLLGFFMSTDGFAPGFGPVSYIDFDIDYVDGQKEGRLQWNSGDGTLEVGMPGGSVNLQIGQEMLVRVTNDTVTQIDNGTPVYISDATGTNIKVTPADADFAAGAGIGLRTFAVATEDIPGSQKGFVTTQGFVRDIDTTFAAVAGLPVYLAVGGGFTTTAPTAPDISFLIGVVTIANSANGGEIYVIQTSIPNLNSLSDVFISSISNEDTLVWDSSDSRWENKKKAYGSMFNHDVTTVVSILATSTPTRIPSGFTVGQTLNTTFQNAREIAVPVAGKYQITWSISFQTSSANQEIEGFAMVDNVIDLQSTAHRRISTATDTGAMSGTSILSLTENQVVAVGVQNETSTANVIIEHSNLSLVKVGN